MPAHYLLSSQLETNVVLRTQSLHSHRPSERACMHSHVQALALYCWRSVRWQFACRREHSLGFGTHVHRDRATGRRACTLHYAMPAHVRTHTLALAQTYTQHASACAHTRVQARAPIAEHAQARAPVAEHANTCTDRRACHHVCAHARACIRKRILNVRAYL